MTVPEWVTLLAPADPRGPVTAIDAGPRWTLPPSPQPVPAIWGRDHMRPGASPQAALAQASRRERALLVLRWRMRRRARVHVHRITPPRFDRDPLRDLLRNALLGGAVAEIAPMSVSPRRLDTVAALAGVQGGVDRVRGSAGGGLLVPVESATGPALLRVRPSGTAAELTRATQALRELAGTAAVPRLLATGRADGMDWMLEERLPGSRPRRVSLSLALEVAGLLARFPRASGGPDATLDDLSVLADVVPEHRGQLHGLARRVQQAAGSLPRIARHGDVWRGNLLSQQGTLTGLVDWDGWHREGIAGADLLQLVAAERRRISGRSLGQEWHTAPWRSSAYRRIAAPYWRHLGGSAPGPELLDAVGIAWWAAEAAGTVRRLPDRSDDRAWLEQNVLAVTASVTGARDTRPYSGSAMVPR